jgi:perosamine synthetase
MSTSRERIPLYRPDLSGNERAYVLECIDSTWISSRGRFIEPFETAIAAATGARHAIAVCNGTVALHLALHCLDLRQGDEVIVPTFTYISPVNTIAQTGATPVFADARASDWTLDADQVERCITGRTRAILAVHLYGMPCDMAALRDLCTRRGIALLEDCAEALGTTIAGRHVGTFGRAGTFSFFGNKTVTTGEGGMVIADDDAFAAKLRLVKGQGQSLTRRYWHEVLGFNYRMTNVEAAIGLAQMERLPQILARKRAIDARYRAMLAEFPLAFQEVSADVFSSHWLTSFLLPHNVDRARVMTRMDELGVETRPVFFCAHDMPMYERKERYPIAEDIAARGVSIPSYPTMTDADQDRVVATIAAALREQLGDHGVPGNP